MGLAGRGARRQKEAAKPRKGGPIALPWQKKGLNRAQKVIAFLEFLPITKGNLAGQSMELLPHQKAFVKAVYGKKGIRLAISSLARGNGKTSLTAGLALCHLIGPEAEMRGEVYSASIDRSMASLLFAEMEAIILRVPEFASLVNIQRFTKKFEVLKGPGEDSIFEALSSDARRGHGLSPSCWIYDELGIAKDRQLLDALLTASGKRARCLGLVISTQPARDDHPMAELIDQAGADPTMVVQVISAPMDADPFDIHVIRACNPALGKFLDEADVMASAEMARRSPPFLPAHRNLRLNQRVDSTTEDRLITPEVWELGNVPLDAARLAGRECYGGLDLSSTTDLTALVLVFPDAAGGFDVLPFVFTPLGALEGRRQAERDLFKVWLAAGQLIGIPGPIITYETVVAHVIRLARLYRIRHIAFDRWRIKDFKAEMDKARCSVPLVDHGQGYQTMGPTVSLFVEKALLGQIRHGGHPPLTASVSSVEIMRDPAGNMKFTKERSTAASIRIDAAVALAMAIYTATQSPADPGAELEAAILARGGFA